MAQVSDEKRIALLRAACAELAGTVIVLDDRLRIVDFSENISEVVGAPLERGISAASVLCGEGENRPIAEALAEGRAVVAEVPRPTPDGGLVMVRIRTTPIGTADDLKGWVLLLEPTSWERGGDAPVTVHGVLTRDPGMKKLLRDVERVARRNATVLVRGETGAGKELIAQAVHAMSPRADGPFRALNCAALPPQLLESELFGHVRGSFTGAVRDYPGHFRLADGGTLFLDEVAELSLDLQAKLLRVLQERTVIPVGGTQPVPVDVRIVSATHRSLRNAVEEGDFRADLMYRLRVVPLFIPPLRARRGDVEALAWLFIDAHNDPEIREIARVSPGALRLLESYDWPGNVRELENAIEYAFAMGEGPVLTEGELPPEVRGEEFDLAINIPRAPTIEPPSPEARRILHALERAGGHKGRAAASLGMSRVTLWRKMKQLGLDDDETSGDAPE